MELALPATLVAVLQGVMTARVCALYRNSKRLSISLYSGLALVQLLNVALTITMSVPPRGIHAQEDVIFGVPGCFYNTPEFKVLWFFGFSNGSICAYELTLIALLVYRAVGWRFGESDCRTSPSGTGGIISLLVHQGLLYFVWVVTYEALSI
ncbi:hypothetical protein CONPUDRAFT_84076 [Coniophora puteana RWD-64-598 SS2]|uniref:Uncharacterized protein n=1 Tax=Coniophora puteana (strain RWD-64-598) TaxID=741705 RepID=A0A5M3MET5_CONPW|nr:uncharacterized protein CONPUDRAFT_84076 [Coniophora puteana RWD-64-598 SS2]EIW77663.1 hypothetical protein CONPUDRAFT_84076 [Coniophora puteana RWD-64-598 SS2]